MKINKCTYANASTKATVLQNKLVHRSRVEFVSFWAVTLNSCWFIITSYQWYKYVVAARVCVNLRYSLGTNPTVDESTPYVYALLLPLCIHCKVLCLHRKWISEAQMPCRLYMNINKIRSLTKVLLNLLCISFPLECVELKLCSPLFVCT